MPNHLKYMYIDPSIPQSVAKSHFCQADRQCATRESSSKEGSKCEPDEQSPRRSHHPIHHENVQEQTCSPGEGVTLHELFEQAANATFSTTDKSNNFCLKLGLEPLVSSVFGPSETGFKRKRENRTAAAKS